MLQYTYHTPRYSLVYHSITDSNGVVFYMYFTAMQDISLFIDGYNLYHSIKNLKDPRLKWVNPESLCKFFINPKCEKINKVKFFTAFPRHKSKDVQDRYLSYTRALRHYGMEVVEGEFKRKISSFYKNKQKFTQVSYEEKESDVNLSIAIVEDSFKKISDKILVITNDSDIAPAIRMAKEVNSKLKMQIISPPISKSKQISYSLHYAAGNSRKNKDGQIFYKVTKIKEFMLQQSIMPHEIVTKNGKIIKVPKEYT